MADRDTLTTEERAVVERARAALAVDCRPLTKHIRDLLRLLDRLSPKEGPAPAAVDGLREAARRALDWLANAPGHVTIINARDALRSALAATEGPAPVQGDTAVESPDDMLYEMTEALGAFQDEDRSLPTWPELLDIARACAAAKHAEDMRKTEAECVPVQGDAEVRQLAEEVLRLRQSIHTPLDDETISAGTSRALRERAQLEDVAARLARALLAAVPVPAQGAADGFRRTVISKPGAALEVTEIEPPEHIRKGLDLAASGAPLRMDAVPDGAKCAHLEPYMLAPDGAQRCAVHGADCPDVLFVRSKQHGYGIPIRDGGESFVAISHCPFCGVRLAPVPTPADGRA